MTILILISRTTRYLDLDLADDNAVQEFPLRVSNKRLSVPSSSGAINRTPYPLTDSQAPAFPTARVRPTFRIGDSRTSFPENSRLSLDLSDDGATGVTLEHTSERSYEEVFEISLPDEEDSHLERIDRPPNRGRKAIYCQSTAL